MHLPRKRFGQHFLHDQGIINRIVAAVDPQSGESLVEIGPGLGAITAPLLLRVADLDVVEIDRDAIRHLRHTLAHLGKLWVHEGDALRFDFSSLAGHGQRLRLVGNLPYNISTPLLFRLIEQRAHVLDMHFTLQKEVVERMAAGAGDDAYGRLSAMLAPWVTVSPLFDIGSGAFRPPPRVLSTFVRLTPRVAPPFVIADYRNYSRVVTAAFSQRRKTLRNALKPLLCGAQIEQAGIDPGARAEVVSPAGFAALAALVPIGAGNVSPLSKPQN